mmetsp:Transcript_61645/g.147005  ORF Transcript_61645/g.147005 Transcript_61645/m.147005 type:complete len:157 (-) Transcript_61645:184-654(-)
MFAGIFRELFGIGVENTGAAGAVVLERVVWRQLIAAPSSGKRLGGATTARIFAGSFRGIGVFVVVDAIVVVAAVEVVEVEEVVVVLASRQLIACASSLEKGRGGAATACMLAGSFKGIVCVTMVVVDVETAVVVALTAEGAVMVRRVVVDILLGPT